MFFEFDSDILLKELSKQNKNETLLNPEEGLIIGNMFGDLYKPYKHFTPHKLTPRNEQEELKLKLQELSFAINDLCLYLDLNPHDQNIHHFYKQYIVELKRIKNIYCEKYGPLTIEEDLTNNYEWIKDPWPWEGYHV